MSKITLKTLSVATALSLLLCFNQSYANVTRIEKNRAVTGSPTIKNKEDGVTLKKETIDINIPQVFTDYESLEKKIQYKIIYLIDSGSRLPKNIELSFLATNSTSIIVKLNNKMLKTSISSDINLQNEFDKKIKKFKNSSKYFNQNGEEIRYSFFNKTDVLDNVKFDADLIYGINTLEIYVEQKMSVDGISAYFGGPKVWYGFDYLFYPALSWDMPQDFELELQINLPNIVEKGWIFDSKLETDFISNLNFNVKKTVDGLFLHSVYKGFPSDFLSFRFRKSRK